MTQYRPMAHPVVFRYLSYSTTFAEYALVHCLWRCPALFRYFSYSITFTEYGPDHRLRRCPALFIYLSCSTTFAEYGPVHRLWLTNRRSLTNHGISGQMRGLKKFHGKGTR